MSMDAAISSAGCLSPFEQLRLARQIIEQEGRVLAEVARRLDTQFCRAVDYLLTCRGNVIVTGIGKAGLVGQKIMATLASTGTPSHWLHPAEAVHGDLGRVHPHDTVLALSQSGETGEIVRLLPPLTEMGVPIVAVTAQADSTLGRAAAAVIELGTIEEACPLGLAPSASTTAMLAVGDALALVASRMRNFGLEDFARFHPAGSLGLRLSKVEDHMRPLAQCRVADQRQTIREVLVAARLPGRRTGATMLVDHEGRLSGIFTDSDLARLFGARRDGQLDAPIEDVMTHQPRRIEAGTPIAEAVRLLARHKISELPVVDAEGRPLGMIDITDMVGLFPRQFASEQFTPEQFGPVAPRAGPCRVFREPEEGGDA